MRTAPSGPPHRLLAIAISIAVVAAGVGVGVVLLVTHTACASTAVGSVQEWTPLVLLNSPYDGNASAVGLRTAGVNGTSVPTIGGALEAANGAAKGLFTLDTWEIVHERTVSRSGWGQDVRCSVTYQGIDLGASALETSRLLAPPNSTSDAAEPWSFSSAGYGSVVFYNGLPGNGSILGQYNTTQSGGGLGFCGPFSGPPPAAVAMSRGTVGESVLVPFDQGGVTAYAPGSVPDLLAFTYNLDPNGTWSWYEAPSGGLAFAFAACPP